MNPFLISLIFLNVVVNAQTKPTSKLLPLPSFDFEGHRGARGLAPENTIPAFLKAISLGVTTLEMDVVVTKDKRVVLSHEPFLSSEICSKADGAPISPDEEKSFNIYQMTFSELSRYDCGRRGHARFARQEAMPAVKPLLQEVIQSAEKACKEKGRPPLFYNIETKSTQEGDEIFHPKPDEFAQLVYDEVKRLGVLNRVIFQSFDERSLESLRKIDADIYLCLLIENQHGLEKNLARLSFTPQIYSPYYKLASPELVRAVHEKGMKLIVWTVNTIEEIKSLRAIGIDGVITDYPNLKNELFK